MLDYKRRFLGILLAVCMVLPSVPAMAEANDLQWITASFHAPGEKADFTCDFPFGEALFFEDENVYHHRLAQASLGLAVSAFRNMTSDLKERDANIRRFLSDTGFGDIVTVDYDVVPNVSTIGTAMAHREIEIDGKTCTLIAVGVSGAGYEDEWESSFTIGDETAHVGFSEAAQKVVARLKAYVADQKLSSPLRMWISGYSRAAAVSNLTAAMVKDDPALPFDALYAYTFATPNTTREVGDYPFIFNIVGQFDPVPAVPFHQWGYDRHGTTLYLPAREVNSDYEARALAVRDTYRNITGGEEYWVNPEANWLVHKLCEFLCEFIEGAGDYSKNYQEIFIDTWDVKGGLLDKLKVCAGEICASPAITSELSEEKMAFWNLLSQVSYNLALEEMGWRSSDWNGAVSLVANVMGEHFPQRYVAWMLSFDTAEETFSNHTLYKRVAIDGPVDFTVSETVSEKIVGAVKDGKIEQIKDSAFSLMRVGDEYLLTCPGDTSYSLVMNATGDGEMQYMVREHQAGYISARTFLFTGVSVKRGQELSSFIGTEQGLPNGDSLLVDSATDNVILPTSDSLNHAEERVTAGSDLNLPGNHAGDFLLWVLLALGAVLILGGAGTGYTVHRHRKKKRAQKKKHRHQG